MAVEDAGRLDEALVSGPFSLALRLAVRDSGGFPRQGRPGVRVRQRR